MARKPTLSPSKITTYLACAAKYRWTYVDARGRMYLRAKSYYSFGTSLHHVLQRFHDSGDQGVTTVSEAVAELEQNWVDAGYESAQEMEEAMGEGRALIENYVLRQATAPVDRQTIMVERSLRMDMGRFDLIGRVDRVDEHENGTIEVVDYKTGRSHVTPEEVQGDLAMGCYLLMLRELYPDRPVIATIVALQTGEEASASLTDEMAEELRQDLKFIGEQMIDREYEYVVPHYKALCPHCDFLRICRMHEEFEEPAIVSDL